MSFTKDVVFHEKKSKIRLVFDIENFRLLTVLCHEECAKCGTLECKNPTFVIDKFQTYIVTPMEMS